MCASVLYVNVCVVHKNMPFDGVQVQVRNDAAYAQVHKSVLASTSACTCTAVDNRLKSSQAGWVAEWA